MSDLKPCPFCGCRKLSGGRNDFGGTTKCDNCDAMGPPSEMSLDGIIEAWNTRATPTLSAAWKLPEVRALVEALERVADGSTKDFTDNYKLARAALAPFTDAKL